jgi:hypothetical protein
MTAADRLRFDTIAERVLAHYGYQPRHYGADSAAALANLETDAAAGYWPCLFGPSTTSGEKAAEEFSEAGEQPAAHQPYRQVLALAAGTPHDLATLGNHLDALAGQLAEPAWLAASGKEALVQRLADLVPSFTHSETGGSLDQRL